MTTDRIIGKSLRWLETLDQVSLLAPVDRAAIILGERGTGKELIAERLHFLSPRWDQPFIKVNCAGFTDTLLESELFGYEPGAFTGASKLYRGRFERAQGGTLFLDELGTLSSRVQEKVLRVIEYGEFDRLGSQKTQKVDVRIVAATNANLPEMVRQGKFRADLLDRLAFDVICLPSLRERKEDIIELAEHFAIRMSHELGWGLFPGFSQIALEELHSYDWPGNVRELKNVVERSVYRWGQESTPINHLVINPFSAFISQLESAPQTKAHLKSNSEKTTLEETESVKVKHEKVISEQINEQEKKKTTSYTTTLPLSLHEAVKSFEINLLEKALQQAQYHQGDAAALLGLTYHQFRGLYRKYQLHTP